MADIKKRTKSKDGLVSMRSVDTVIRQESDLSFLSVIQQDKIDISLAEKATLANNSALQAVKKATRQAVKLKLAEMKVPKRQSVGQYENLRDDKQESTNLNGGQQAHAKAESARVFEDPIYERSSSSSFSLPSKTPRVVIEKLEDNFGDNSE